MSASMRRPLSGSKVTVVTPIAIGSCDHFWVWKMTAFEFGPSLLYSTLVQARAPALITEIDGKLNSQVAVGHRANELETIASVSTKPRPSGGIPRWSTENETHGSFHCRGFPASQHSVAGS